MTNTPNLPTLIRDANGTVRASSLEVAERFGKRHADVLRDIRAMISALEVAGQPIEIIGRNFAPFKIKDLTGESTSHYLMDRDGFTLLAMGFTGADALKWKLTYIQAFNAMEAELNERGNARTDEEVLISLGVDPASATMLVTNRRKMEALSAQQAVTDTKADRALEMAAQAKAHYIPSECYSVMAWANLNDIAITLTPAAQIGKIATAYSRANNLPKDLISDPRFGVAGVYMKEALEHRIAV